MSKDYYDILGVSKDASEEEIKKAFRKKAHEHHPDKAGGDEAKFKEASAAYQVLSNKQKRAQYDQFGAGFEQMGGAGGGNPSGGFQGQNVNFDFSQMGGFGDIFGEMFGGGGRRSARTGADIQVDVKVEFKDIVFGSVEKVKLYRTSVCDECKATGVAPGSKMSKCPECGGQGRVRRVQQTMFGAFQTMAACTKCQGTGEIPDKPCVKCQGTGVIKATREFELKIPAGISDGETLRVSGEGEAVKGGAPGDLYVTVRVKPDKRFARQGDNILGNVDIPFQDAALGVTVPIETVEGDVSLKVPAGTQPGTIMRLRGKGVPALHGGNRGDFLVTVNVKIPVKLTREQKKKLEDW